jgi:tRNA pseudouridine-54 N-methylase
MKRRTFIYTGIGITALLGLGDLFLLNYESKWKKQPFLYPLILSNILDEECLRIVGNSYRVMRPDENSKAKLLNAITSEMQTIHGKTNDISNQAMEIEKIVEKDFKSERLIVIKGWVLSETEARQCALLSLS